MRNPDDSRTDDTGGLGQLASEAEHWRLSFTRHLPHPPEKVWRAITDPEHLHAWFPARVDGERRQGAALRFVFEHDEGPTTDGTVTVYDPPSVFEFTWGVETLRFELTPDEGGTLLVFVNTFDELGKAARDAAGWHYCLELLGYDLAGEQPPDEAVQRWKTVHPLYVAAFGPEAATLGPPESMSEYQ
jgi:uncharacterized protein YndB with AHSA1/START domain